MKKFCIGIYLILIIVPAYCAASAVTHELSPGRFGDNLISYIHAKWIAYKYNIPLLYKPFVYSDHLRLHEVELPYAVHYKKFKNTVYLGKKSTVTSQAMATLYVVPYFPESKWELKHGISFSGKAWDYIAVDWHDPQFIALLRHVIAPRTPQQAMALPPDRIWVAIHMRKGGNHDTPETLPGFPLKFLPDEFYITQLHKLYALLQERPLYVYLFTDDNNPLALMHKFQSNCAHLNIQFDCRRHGNCDTRNVIEDFFALQQFDCLLHSESNFSFIASKLGTYMVSLFPDSFYKVHNQIVYDHINLTLNRQHHKFQ
jgi:hypothetical protein